MGTLKIENFCLIFLFGWYNTKYIQSNVNLIAVKHNNQSVKNTIEKKLIKEMI
jgi:hypothetical protein